MNMKISSLALATLCLSGNALAQVTVAVPDTIEVLVANGETPKLEGSLFDAHKSLVLPDGENQILFRYKPYFSQGNDRIIVESQAVLAKFNASETELEFQLPEYRNEKQARQKLDKEQWRLLDDKGATVKLKQDLLLKDGMQVGRNYKQEVLEYNRRGGVASVYEPTSQAMRNAAATQGDTTPEEMLHFWYEKADKATKERFKQFVLESK